MVDRFLIIVFLGMKLLQVSREKSRIRTPHSTRSLHQLQMVTTITTIRKPSPRELRGVQCHPASLMGMVITPIVRA